MTMVAAPSVSDLRRFYTELYAPSQIALSSGTYDLLQRLGT
jgi:hypothetical protein